MKNTNDSRYQALLELLRGYGRVCLAFSGGVDSTFLAYAAKEALGAGNVLAVTARSASYPARELDEARAFCADHGIPHEVIDSEELDIDGFAHNPPNRCYLCKRELFTKLRAVADAAGIGILCEGSNADDPGDYRPGMQAVRELGVKSPLREAGLTKDMIREISKSLGLPTWDKQAFACLSSRFVYGEDITLERLAMIDKAEQFLLDEGFRFVRVRIHGNDHPIARIEVRPADIERLAAMSGRVNDYLKQLGFAYVALDLGGYQTGSMNATL
ncbi:MAG: ATP-dependent sacrificial sulfur transferase LarE [Clostridiales Family XIII bacterium]|nr:ATP-dependent sacrificial sulfur transferase LarE [Clostridiales Family XIII bacterium]